jgi:hypothetical protein
MYFYGFSGSLLNVFNFFSDVSPVKHLCQVFAPTDPDLHHPRSTNNNNPEIPQPKSVPSCPGVSQFHKSLMLFTKNLDSFKTINKNKFYLKRSSLYEHWSYNYLVKLNLRSPSSAKELLLMWAQQRTNSYPVRKFFSSRNLYFLTKKTAFVNCEFF